MWPMTYSALQTFYGIFGVFMTPDLPAASVLSAMSYGMPLKGSGRALCCAGGPVVSEVSATACGMEYQLLYIGQPCMRGCPPA